MYPFLCREKGVALFLEDCGSLVPLVPVPPISRVRDLAESIGGVPQILPDY